MKINVFAYILTICCLSWSMVVSGESDYPVFTIDNLIDPSWGKLVSVFDQKNSQRLTFENDGRLTLVGLHLSWNSKQNAFVPKVRQVIHLNKKNAL